MRFALALLLTTLFACDGSDISDNPPVSSTPIDSGTDDADVDDDGGLLLEDGGLDIDASLPDSAAAFCTRFSSICGYEAKPGSFADESACLAAYNGFDLTRQTCVTSELNLAESDGVNPHCGRATGSGPCS